MKKIAEKCAYPLAIMLAGILALAPLTPAFAHEGEDHKTEIEAGAHEKKVARVMSMTEMEQMITLLRQLIALMVEQKRVASQPPAPLKAEMKVHHDEHAADDHKEEGDDHETAAASEEKKFVIEVEQHFGKTHVHIRYTEKAEDMYFAEAKITDEAALINSIKTRSGLNEAVIKSALKYL